MTSPFTPKSNRKALGLVDRVKVINLVDSGKSCRNVAEEIGV